MADGLRGHLGRNAPAPDSRTPAAAGLGSKQDCARTRRNSTAGAPAAAPTSRKATALPSVQVEFGIRDFMSSTF